MIAILENLSTTTYTQSCPRLVVGSLDIKSIEIDFHALSGIGNGKYRPNLRFASFAIAQAAHAYI